MPSHDFESDERFESYLKQFEPLAPEPLPITARSSTGNFWSRATWAAAIAAIIIVGVFVVRPAPTPSRNSKQSESTVNESSQPTPPLTIASANALLAPSPSVQAAIDQATFHVQPAQPPQGKRSALAVLSKATEKL